MPVDELRELRAAADAAPWSRRRDLPRWHRTNGSHELADQAHADYVALYGRSWVWKYDAETRRRIAVREGTRSRLPWLGRDRYLNGTVPLRLAQSDAQAVLRAHRVDRDTFRRWMRHETLWADPRNGRRCVVRPVSVAQLMEVDERTVHRCRAVGRALGLYATVHRGRMLDQLEQMRARWAGSAQRGMAAESWFVLPFDLAVPPAAGGRITPVSYLQRGSGSGHLSNLPGHVVTFTARGEDGAASPPSTRKRRRRAPSPGYRLAEQLLQALPWAASCPAGRLSGLLGRFASSRHPWTAQDVVQHINTVNLRRGWSAIAGVAELRAPAFALLASYLRDADPDADHPRLTDFEAADRAAAAADARAEHRRRGCSVPAGADNCGTCGARFAVRK